jgi:hypothetical protein
MKVHLKELKTLGIMLAGFLAAYFVSFESARFHSGITEAFYMLQDYARLHVLLCLIPALFIAGAVSVFVSSASVMKYLGPAARKAVAYGVASVSGAILAVCSCTILPLFSGIYKRGAGLGPAIAFLYSGPAINVLAIVMTARILGLQIGIARAVGAVVFSIVIGLIMHILFRKEENMRQEKAAGFEGGEEVRPIWQTIIYFTLMILILIFLNWARPNSATASGFVVWAFSYKWIISAALAFLLGLTLNLYYGFHMLKVLAITMGVIIAGLVFPMQPLIPFVTGIVLLSLFLGMEQGELRIGWVLPGILPSLSFPCCFWE